MEAEGNEIKVIWFSHRPNWLHVQYTLRYAVIKWLFNNSISVIVIVHAIYPTLQSQSLTAPHC